MNPSAKTMMIGLAALALAQAPIADSATQTESSQATDAANIQSVESERSRLGMQRIQTEAEIKAREEQQRLEEEQRKARQEQWRLEQVERERAQAEAMQSQAAIVPSTPSAPTATAESKDMSQTLEQLRTLGELKDDGYITDEEFKKIKQRILDSQL